MLLHELFELDKYQQLELSLISRKVADFISIKISVCDLCHNIIFCFDKTNFKLFFHWEVLCGKEIKFTFKTKYLIYIYPGAIESLLTCYIKIVCLGCPLLSAILLFFY